MALHDYAEMDEEDYYGQEFEKEGVLSLWVGMKDDSDLPDVDVLQDLCGVGYYDLDQQEGNCRNFDLVPLIELLSELSYSRSFLEPVLAEAKARGIELVRWVIVQYDFAYDPQRVKRKIEDEPVFLGVFEYSADDD